MWATHSWAPRLGRLGVARRWIAARGVPKIGMMNTVFEVLQAHEQHGRVMSGMDVSACWNMLGRLVKNKVQRHWLHVELLRRPVLLPLLRTTMRGLPHFKARPVANTTHGLATVANIIGFVPDDPVWEALSEESLRHVGDFKPQEISNTAWAFAKAEHQAPELFAAIAAEVLTRRLADFNLQGIVNIAWAFAKVEDQAPKLFAAIAAEVPTRRLADFKPQDIANTAWAFAKVEDQAPELFAAIAAEVRTRRLADFKPQEIANIAWAFAKAEHPAPELFAAIAAEVRTRRLADFNPQHIANTAWAFAKVEHQAPELFAAIAADMHGRFLTPNERHALRIAFKLQA